MTSQTTNKFSPTVREHAVRGTDREHGDIIRAVGEGRNWREADVPLGTEFRGDGPRAAKASGIRQIPPFPLILAIF